MNLKKAILLTFTLIFGLGIGGTVNAMPITFDFTGTVDSRTGIWLGADIGSLVTGSYTYDTGLVDALSASTALDYFWSHSPSTNQPFLWDMTVTAGGITRSTSSNQNLDGTWHHWLRVQNSTTDAYMFESRVIIATDDLARINLVDSSATAFGPLSGSPPATAPDLSAFNTRQGIYTANNSTTGLGTVTFTLDSITSSNAVPEPATMLLLGFGLIGLAGLGRKKIKKK